MSNNFTAVLRRRALLIVLVPLIAVGITVALPGKARTGAKVYRATDIVAVDQSSGVSFITASQASLRATKGIVASRAARILRSDVDPIKLASGLKVKPDDTSFSLFFQADNRDPEQARRYVEAFAKAFVQVENQAELRKRDSVISQFRTTVEDARAALQEFQFKNAAELAKPNPLPDVTSQQQFLQQQVSQANQQLQGVLQQRTQVLPYSELGSNEPTVPPQPAVRVPTSRLARGLLALILSAGLTLLFVMVLERVSPRVDDRETIEQIVGAPVLAVVPDLSRRERERVRRATKENFVGSFAEAFRLLRSHLAFISSEGSQSDVPTNGATRVGPRPADLFNTILVSATPGEGKTTAAAYLAHAIAEAGQRPVIIDCDTRRPSIHRMFDMRSTPGLSTLISTNAPSTTTGMIQVHESTGIRVVPGGHPTTQTASLARHVGQFVEAARENGRSVVIDTAPVLVSHEALDLLPLVDHVVIVVRAHKTPQRSLRRAVEVLELHRAKIAGALVTGTSDARDASSYYYSYEYGHDAPRQRWWRRGGALRQSGTTKTAADVHALDDDREDAVTG